MKNKIVVIADAVAIVILVGEISALITFLVLKWLGA